MVNVDNSKKVKKSKKKKFRILVYFLFIVFIFLKCCANTLFYNIGNNNFSF